MIAWKYINKTSATIAALRDYNNMRFVFNNIPDEIKEMHASMTAPRSSNLSGMPSVHNPQAGEGELVAQIDKLDILWGSYYQAIDYMAWFEPAWTALTDTERHILAEFYMGENLKSGATYRLVQQLNYSESHVERLRSNALSRLQTLLFG